MTGPDISKTHTHANTDNYTKLCLDMHSHTHTAIVLLPDCNTDEGDFSLNSSSLLN